MKASLSTRAVTWFLAVATLGVVAVTAQELVRSGGLAPLLYAPAAALLAVLAAWPFLVGWRPFTPHDRRLRDCRACGAQWRPRDEGTLACPACGHAAA